MSNEIRLQSRDIELLVFLGRYKMMSLDNTRYIYETVTYQEKRMVALVKHNYIKRLKHRYITLGTKGKEYLLENGFEISVPLFINIGDIIKIDTRTGEYMERI